MASHNGGGMPGGVGADSGGEEQAQAVILRLASEMERGS